MLRLRWSLVDRIFSDRRAFSLMADILLPKRFLGNPSAVPVLRK
jgi:hypothetical protein